MSDKAALIIGASRGIGLGMAEELARRGYRVFASQRSSSEKLERAAAQSHARIEIVAADVTEPESIAALGNAIAPGSLDLLVMNAGVYGGRAQAIPELTRDVVADILMTNAVGPVQSAVTLLPLVRDGGTVAMLTSKMGSIADSSGGTNLYRMSKVAQNMLSRSLFENHARARSIPVLSLHPGWVRTDMGGPNALVSVEESVSGMIDVVERKREPVHEFLDYQGNPVPW